MTAAKGSEPRRRLRFVGVDRAIEHHRVTITVRLEWNDATHEGQASSEKGAAIELKTAAQAAVRAIEKASGRDLGLRIIGVKPIHAFDSDLMVVSLLRTADGEQQRLIGAVIVHETRATAAALAVLSALNRTLGNIIETSD